MSQADRFSIATRLLDDGATGQAWANLGLWHRSGMTYPEAARALAARHWQLAAPMPGARLLDAGCGHGASLRHWLERDPTLRLSALECQPACLQQLQGGPWTVVNGRFDALPPPPSLTAASQDALLCVDAAYHARSLADFARFAAHVLRPGGTLVFSTLLVAADTRPGERLLLRAAGIPRGSQVSSEVMAATLASAGLRLTQLQDAGDEGDGVLAGFARFTQQRARGLSRDQRLSAGWLKIAMTGRLCARLASRHAVRYVLIRATRDD